MAALAIAAVLCLASSVGSSGAPPCRRPVGGGDGKLVVNYVLGRLPARPLGGTHLILSFLEPTTAGIPAAGDNAWVKHSIAELAGLAAAERTAYLERFHSSGTKVMASVGGALVTPNLYKQYDAGVLGARAAQYVADLGLDGLDIDLEHWGNDPGGAAFLRALTRGAHGYFAGLPGGKRYVLTHAPEMPDFWNGVLYMELMADREYFDMIDFVNVQMYNQIQFPSRDYVFIKDVYDPRVNAPTCLGSIAVGVSNASSGRISLAEARAKLLLGFPCKDGSFPVGSANLNMCGAPQSQLVTYGVETLGFPLAGVFEWSAEALPDADIESWNLRMRGALGGGCSEVQLV